MSEIYACQKYSMSEINACFFEKYSEKLNFIRRFVAGLFAQGMKQAVNKSYKLCANLHSR